jgi:hypothetical protein
VLGAAIKAQVVSFPPNGIDCEQLNVDITLVEVQQSFKKLKRHKAAGIDGIKPKFLLDVVVALQQPLLIVFNKILCEGYCESLSVGIIHALYKGGDCSQFDNYRGITVGPVLAKVFAMILESHINQWAYTIDLRAKGQTGFRKDFKITDNLFILRTLTEQARFQKNNYTLVLWTSKKPLIQYQGTCCGRCWRDLTSVGGYWSACAPCIIKTRPACTIQRKGSRPLSSAASE